MDPITAALLNYGPLGIVVVILLFLHTQNIKNFREDQEKQRAIYKEQLEVERSTCINLWQQYLQVQLKHHEEVMDGIRGIESHYLRGQRS